MPSFLHLLYSILSNVIKGTFLECASYAIIQSLKSLKLSLFSTMNADTFSIIFPESQETVKYSLCNNSSIFFLTFSLSIPYLGSTKPSSTIESEFIMGSYDSSIRTLAFSWWGEFSIASYTRTLVSTSTVICFFPPIPLLSQCPHPLMKDSHLP